MKRYFSKNLFLTVLIATPLLIGPVFVNAQYYDDYGAYDSYFGGGSYFSDYGAYDNYSSDYSSYDNYFSDYGAYDNYFSGDNYSSGYNTYDNYLGNYFGQNSYDNYYSDYNAYDNYFSQDASNSYYDGYNSYDNYLNNYFSQDAYNSYYQDYNAYDNSINNYFDQNAYNNYYQDYNAYDNYIGDYFDNYFGQQTTEYPYESGYSSQGGYCGSCSSQGGYCPSECYSQGYGQQPYREYYQNNQYPYYNNPGFYADFNYIQQPPVIIQQPPIIQPPVVIQQPPIIQPPVIIQQPPVVIQQPSVIQQPCVNCAVPQEEICYDCPAFDNTEEIITPVVYTNIGTVSKTEAKVITIKMFVKNSSDPDKWSKEISLKTTDKADFMITVLNNTDKNLSNVNLKLNIPEEMSYSAGYNLDNESKTGDLTKGVDIGPISAEEAKIITFTAGFNQSKFSNNETKQLEIKSNANAQNYDTSDSITINSQNIQTQTASVSLSAFKNWYMWFLVVLIIILLVLLFNKYYSGHQK